MSLFCFFFFFACLSISLLYHFLTLGKPKHFHRVAFKSRWNICSFTNFVTRLPLASLHVEGKRTMGSHCCSNFLPLDFTTAKKTTFFARMTYHLSILYVHNDIETLLDSKIPHFTSLKLALHIPASFLELGLVLCFPLWYRRLPYAVLLIMTYYDWCSILSKRDGDEPLFRPLLSCLFLLLITAGARMIRRVHISAGTPTAARVGAGSQQ